MIDAKRPAAARDSAFMRRALSLAREGWGQTAPNPMVGAVVVRDDEIVGEGYHARYGGDHAEVVALRNAGARARGATVYVTLEPCAHVGQTPPCTDALEAAGVKRVVAAVRDPNPVARGGGDRLVERGIAFDHGVEAAAACELNAPFFHAFGADRPWVTLKLALSLDGAIADASRARRWLTGEEARREVHRLRAGSDAIAVGIGTVLADDPALTVREVPPPRVPPLRVVFDRTARLPLSSALARTAREARTVVLAEAPDPQRMSALVAAGVEVATVRSLAAGLRWLHDAGIRSLLVEGGAGLAAALLGHSAVDRLIIFQSPLLLGAGALGGLTGAPARLVGEARRLGVVERRTFGDDLMTVYAFEPGPCSPD
jgi:diaminohydroxyphosphoribosylaminopyrimidine deaminase / 5-amino-6-(5-phosphoribosylamino)uracil reductase